MVLQGLHVPLRSRRVDRLAPRLARSQLGVAEVERGLLVVEVLQVEASARSGRRHPRRRTGCARREPLAVVAVGPDVAVAERTRAVGMQLGLEPRVVARRVTGHEVEQDPDAARLRLCDKAFQILVGAVARRHQQVVGHVVAGVHEGRREAWVEPDRVDAQPLQVVQVGDDAREVTDPVAVRVGERLWVDLVDDGVSEPVGRRGHAAFDISRDPDSAVQPAPWAATETCSHSCQVARREA